MGGAGRQSSALREPSQRDRQSLRAPRAAGMQDPGECRFRTAAYRSSRLGSLCSSSPDAASDRETRLKSLRRLALARPQRQEMSFARCILAGLPRAPGSTKAARSLGKAGGLVYRLPDAGSHSSTGTPGWATRAQPLPQRQRRAQAASPGSAFTDSRACDNGVSASIYSIGGAQASKTEVLITT